MAANHSFWNGIEGTFGSRTVLGKKIDTCIAMVDPMKVAYDPLNPRLQTLLASRKITNPTQPKIHKLMLENKDQVLLAQALKVSGAAWDAILVDSNGIVKEGNRRKWASMENKKAKDRRFNMIAAEAFLPEITDEQWQFIKVLC